MPQPQLDSLIEYCNNINNPLNIITASDYLHYPVSKQVNMHWWNTYWLMKTYNGILHYSNGRKVSIELDEPVDYKHYFISMNNRSHYHRCHMIDMLAKHNLIEKGAVSLHQDAVIYEWKHFNFRRMLLEPEYMNDTNQYRVPSQYYDSFAQLISESSGNVIMMSEKTATPLLLGKPFLVASQRHFHQFLKRLGFELFEEIFDYSFDDEPDEGIRYDMLIQNFKRLTEIPISELPELLNKIKGKLIHNQKRAVSIVMDTSLYPDIALDVIRWYEKTGKIIDKHLIDDWESLQGFKFAEI